MNYAEKRQKHLVFPIRLFQVSIALVGTFGIVYLFYYDKEQRAAMFKA